MLRTGTTVVTVTFKNIKTAKSTAKKYRCVVKAAIEQKPEEPATTAAKITAIKQEKATKLAAEFSADMTGIKYTDLKIVRDETGAVVTVKSATVDSKDNTKVTIETYEALTDGKAYTVTYTANDEAKTESSAAFTATAGVVSEIALNTYSIPANTPTEIKYQLLDANGVLIEEKGIGKSKSDKVDISVENFNGYQSNNDLLLYKTGDTATLKVVYHTWKYNNTDGTEEGKVEKEFKITAVDQSSVIETYEYSVADASSIVDFKRDTLKTQVAIDDDKTANPAAHFSFRKADGTDITRSLDYTVSSGNENVLLASGNVADLEGAKLTPVAAGATYLVIKNASGAVVKTLPITVVAKRELSTMSVDKSNVTVAQTSGAAGKQVITVSVMDQYSDSYTKYTASQPELKSNNNDTNLSVTSAPDPNNANKTLVTVQTTGTGAEVGTYVYTMDLTDDEKGTNVKKVTFSVTVSKVLTTVNNSYALVMMNDSQDGIVTKVDTTVTAGTFNPTTLMPTIVAKNNGSIVGTATIDGTTSNDIVSFGALTLKKNGTSVDNTNNIYTGTGNNVINNSSATVVVTKYVGTTIVKNLEPGTYTLSLTATLKDGKKQNMSTSFVVEDSQKVFEANVKNESVGTEHDTLAQVFTDKDYVSFSYAGHEIDGTPYTYVSADATNINGKKAINVKKVTMDVVLPGTGSKTVRMTTAVNRTFTFANDVVSASQVTNQINLFNKNYVQNNALKTGLTATQYAQAVKDAIAIDTNSQSSELTAAEQAGLATNAAKTKAIGQAAAVEIINAVTASTSTSDILNAMKIFDTVPVSSDVNEYQSFMSSATFANVTTSNAKTVIESLIDSITNARIDTAADLTTAKNKLNTLAVSGAAATATPVDLVFTVAAVSSDAIVVTAGAAPTCITGGGITVLTASVDNSSNKVSITATFPSPITASGASVTVDYTISVSKTVTVNGVSKTYYATNTPASETVKYTYNVDADEWRK